MRTGEVQAVHQRGSFIVTSLLSNNCTDLLWPCGRATHQTSKSSSNSKWQYRYLMIPGNFLSIFLAELSQPHIWQPYNVCFISRYVQIRSQLWRENNVDWYESSIDIQLIDLQWFSSNTEYSYKMQEALSWGAGGYNNNNVLLCYQQPPTDWDWSESNREER